MISTSGTGCTTALIARRSDGTPITRTIEWSGAHEIETGPQPGAPYYKGGIAIHGGVTGYAISDGRMDTNATPDLRDRLEKAFNFLRTACDAGKQYGY